MEENKKRMMAFKLEKAEEIKLTFSEWVKKQLTAEEVEKRINKRKDSDAVVQPLANEGIVVLTKGTKW